MPPKTLSRQQFQKKRPGGSYAKYLAYVQKARKNAAPPTPDPFAPFTDQQVRQQVRATLSPIEREVMAGIRGRETQDIGAIERGSEALAQSLTGYDERARGYYAGAQSNVAATNDALAQRVSGQGTDLSSSLAERLAKAGVTDTTIAADAASRGTASSNAGYAQGTYDLNELAKRGASAETFYAGLPAFARQRGAQSIAARRAAGAGERSDARLKFAELFAGRLGDAQDRELDKAIAREGFRVKDAAATADAASDAYEDAQPDSSLSKVYGYVVDSNGNPILDADGKRQKVAKTAPKGENMTKLRRQALSQANTKALSIVRANAATVPQYDMQPKVDALGDPIPDPTKPGSYVMERVQSGTRVQAPYYETIHQIEAAVAPILEPAGFTRAEITRLAQRLANEYYKAGQAGRPGTGRRDPYSSPGPR